MKEQYYTLELHKILELLAEQCSNEASKKAVLEIEPDNDISNVRAEVDKTFDAYNACVRFGSPSFINFPNAKTIAHRAQSGSELSLRELLDVSRMLFSNRSFAFVAKAVPERGI